MIRPSGLDVKYQDLSGEAKIREMERDEVLYKLDQTLDSMKETHYRPVFYDDIDDIFNNNDFDDNIFDMVEDIYGKLYKIRREKLQYQDYVDTKITYGDSLEWVVFGVLLAIVNIPFHFIDYVLAFVLAVVGIPILVTLYYKAKQNRYKEKVRVLDKLEKSYIKDVKKLIKKTKSSK